MDDTSGVEAAQRDRGEARRSGVILRGFAAFASVFADQISMSHENLRC
jgi:hypothetical protein